ncbi:hypothetical protein [uncultured Herbaspirillum sp.]|nr:hypothetical protein [uncultured Herbaspirillum sp.]
MNQLLEIEKQIEDFVSADNVLRSKLCSKIPALVFDFGGSWQKVILQ